MNTIPKIHHMQDAPEGLYVGFFHGRDTVDEELNDWGYDGPVIGPINWWHTTYEKHIRAELCAPRELAALYMREGLVDDWGMFELQVVEGMAFVGGKYYGDWSVFYHKNEVRGND